MIHVLYCINHCFILLCFIILLLYLVFNLSLASWLLFSNKVQFSSRTWQTGRQTDTAWQHRPRGKNSHVCVQNRQRSVILFSPALPHKFSPQRGAANSSARGIHRPTVGEVHKAHQTDTRVLRIAACSAACAVRWLNASVLSRCTARSALQTTAAASSNGRTTPTRLARHEYQTAWLSAGHYTAKGRDKR